MQFPLFHNLPNLHQTQKPHIIQKPLITILQILISNHHHNINKFIRHQPNSTYGGTAPNFAQILKTHWTMWDANPSNQLPNMMFQTLPNTLYQHILYQTIYSLYTIYKCLPWIIHINLMFTLLSTKHTSSHIHTMYQHFSSYYLKNHLYSQEMHKYA